MVAAPQFPTYSRPAKAALVHTVILRYIPALASDTPCASLAQAEMAAAAEEEAAAAAAALGLLQPLEALSLDADALRTATAAAVAYCDSQGVTSFADLIERASRLIVHPQAAPSYCLESSWP